MYLFKYFAKFNLVALIGKEEDITDQVLTQAAAWQDGEIIWFLADLTTEGV